MPGDTSTIDEIKFGWVNMNLTHYSWLQSRIYDDDHEFDSSIIALSFWLLLFSLTQPVVVVISILI